MKARRHDRARGRPGRDRGPAGRRPAAPLWLFDLDNTLHDAAHASDGPTAEAMTDYIAEHLGLPEAEAGALRSHYWQRYGATLLGLVRHHGVKAGHFLEQTHRLPGLESRLRTSAHDCAALRRLPGRKYILTNAPRAYALRVLNTLRLAVHFDGVISIEDMRMFGHPRPKPDGRMLRQVAARLKVPTHRCVLVEDTLQHQRSACKVGMRAIWMQRYLPDEHFDTEAGGRLARKPPYVYARIHSLKTLRSMN